MALGGGGFGRQILTAPAPRKKAAPKSKTKNPFLHGSGGPKAKKRIDSSNSYNYKQLTQKAKPKAKAKTSSGGTTGAGGKFYKNGYVDSKGNKVVNGRWVAPSAKAKSSGSSSSSSSSSKKTGGAWSRDGKRFYKNGYVDSKGNKVVNGKWTTGGSSKSSGGGSSAKKVTSTSTNTVKKASATAVAPKKINLLASDYEDQVYKNQLAELNAADAAYGEDTEAKTKRLSRDYKLNRANVGLNKTNSLQNSAEDYASRGMMRSGAYQNNLAETTKLFDDQTSRMASNFSDDNADYARAKSDYLRGSNTQKQDAKRQLGERIAFENSKRTANGTS